MVRKRGKQFRIQDSKCYPLLLKFFEENGGTIFGKKLDELEAAVEGELTRRQISRWCAHRREKLGIRPFNTIDNKRYPKRTKSVLLHVFDKNSGNIDGEELDELEKTLELTRRQIMKWFYHRRRARDRRRARTPL